MAHGGEGLRNIHEEEAGHLPNAPRVPDALHELKQGINGAAARTASKLVRGEETMPLREPGEPIGEDRLHHFAEALLLSNGAVRARHGVIALPGLPQGYRQEDPPGLRKVTDARQCIEHEWNKIAREAGVSESATITFVNEVNNEAVPPDIDVLFTYLERRYISTFALVISESLDRALLWDVVVIMEQDTDAGVPAAMVINKLLLTLPRSN
ncbi:hypothetical protein B0H13DRAFT_2360686 [Mycena leptocephala]|nr:hypothetical protein B0H13DRAFT_2360686 [Mycena leptocephala]